VPIRSTTILAVPDAAITPRRVVRSVADAGVLPEQLTSLRHSALPSACRNCRERLVMHNERRNKRKVLSQAAAREEREKDRHLRFSPGGTPIPGPHPGGGGDGADDDAAGGPAEQARPKRTRVPVRRLGGDSGDGGSEASDLDDLDDDDLDSGTSLSFSRRSGTASRSPSAFARTSLSARSVGGGAFKRDSAVSVGGGHLAFARLSTGGSHHAPHAPAADPLNDAAPVQPTRPRALTPVRAGPGTGAAPGVGGLEALMAAAEQEAAAAKQAAGESGTPRGPAATIGGPGGAFQAPVRSSGTFQPVVTPQQALSVQQLWDSAVAEQQQQQQQQTAAAEGRRRANSSRHAAPGAAAAAVEVRAPAAAGDAAEAPQLGAGPARATRRCWHRRRAAGCQRVPARQRGQRHVALHAGQRAGGGVPLRHRRPVAAADLGVPATRDRRRVLDSQRPAHGGDRRAHPRDDSPPSDADAVAAPLSARSSYNSTAPSVMDLSPWGGLKSGSSLWAATGSGLAGPLSRLSGSDAGAAQTPQHSPRHHVPAPLTVRAPPTNAFGGIARRGEPLAEAASVLAAAQRRANKTEPFVSPFGAASGTAAALAAIAALSQQQQPLNGAAAAPLGPVVQRPVPQHAAALSLPMSPGHSAAADATQQAQQAVTALINNALLEALMRNKAEQAFRAQQQGQQGLLFAESAAAALASAAVPAATHLARPAARPAVQSAASRQWVGIMRTSLIASPVSLAAVGLCRADEVGLGDIDIDAMSPVRTLSPSYRGPAYAMLLLACPCMRHRQHEHPGV